MGTGGFVVFDDQGECLVADARFYGGDLPTNNRAEVRALWDLMRWLAVEKPDPALPVVVFGDSQLVINFCNRRARPSVGDLYEAV